jgi:hypothetical protein
LGWLGIKRAIPGAAQAKARRAVEHRWTQICRIHLCSSVL